METTFGKIIETKKMSSPSQQILTKSQLSLFNNNRMTNSLMIDTTSPPHSNIYNSLRIKTSTPLISQSVSQRSSNENRGYSNRKLNLNGYLSDSECKNNSNNSYKKINQE